MQFDKHYLIPALGTFSASIEHYPSTVTSIAILLKIIYYIICMHDVGEGRTCYGICVVITIP